MKDKYIKPRNLADILKDPVVQSAGYEDFTENENGNMGAYYIDLESGWCFGDDERHCAHGTLKHVCNEMRFVTKCKSDCYCHDFAKKNGGQL
jgi:hypothetical protein